MSLAPAPTIEDILDHASRHAPQNFPGDTLAVSAAVDALGIDFVDLQQSYQVAESKSRVEYKVRVEDPLAKIDDPNAKIVAHPSFIRDYQRFERGDGTVDLRGALRNPGHRNGPVAQELYSKAAKIMARVREIEASAPLFSSPAAILETAFIGDQQKASYIAELQGAGPAKVHAYALKALSSGDRRLASAALAANVKLPTKERRFDSKILTDRFTQGEFDNVQAKIKLAKEIAQRAKDLASSFYHGRPPTSALKVKLGAEKYPD